MVAPDVIYHNEIEQNTPEWDFMRGCMPTASEFTKLLTPATLKASKSVDDYALEIAAGIWSGVPIDSWQGNYYTNRGHELEDEARAWYALNYDVEVTQVGFIQNNRLNAGCSPDGLMSAARVHIEQPDDPEDPFCGLLEIKCFGVKEHIRTLACKECPTKYLIQPHGQMLVSEREYVDMLFYHPSLPKRVWRVWPDRNIAKLLESQIKVCNGLVNHYLQVIEKAA